MFNLQHLTTEQLQEIANASGDLSKVSPETVRAFAYGPPPAPAQPTVEEQGPFGAGVDYMQADLQTALSAVANRLGFSGIEQSMAEAAEANRLAGSGFTPSVGSWREAETPSDWAKFLYEGAAQSAPYLVGSIGAGIAGAALAPAAIPAAAAGVTAASAFSFPFLAGANVQRQMEENGVSLEDVRVGDAFATAVAQSVLEGSINAVAPGVGKVFKATSGSVTRAIPQYAAAAITGGAVEGATESAQQALEILQANPDKLYSLEPEVADELINAAILGATLGAPAGAFTNVVERSGQKQRYRRETEQLRGEFAGEAESLRRAAEDVDIDEADIREAPPKLLADESGGIDRYSDPADFTQPLPQEPIRIVADKPEFTYGERGGDVGAQRQVKRPGQGFRVVGEETGSVYKTGFKTEKEANDWVENSKERELRKRIHSSTSRLETAGLFEEALEQAESSDVSPEFKEALKRKNKARRELYAEHVSPIQDRLDKFLDGTEDQYALDKEDSLYAEGLRRQIRHAKQVINRETAIKGREFDFFEPRGIDRKKIAEEIKHPDERAKLFTVREVVKKGSEPTYTLREVKEDGKDRKLKAGTEEAMTPLMAELQEKNPKRKYYLKPKEPGKTAFAVVEQKLDTMGNVIDSTFVEPSPTGPKYMRDRVVRTFDKAVDAERFRRDLKGMAVEEDPAETMAAAKRADEFQEIISLVNNLLRKYNVDGRVSTRFSETIQDKVKVGETEGTIYSRGKLSTDPRLGRVMEIATALPKNPNDQAAIDTILSTVRHESLHVLRELNLITPGEWSKLVKGAKNISLPDKPSVSFTEAARIRNEKIYADSPNKETILEEEAVAMMFEDFGRNPHRYNGRPVQRGIFRKIIDFFKGLMPFSKSDAVGRIFESIEAGEVGRRRPSKAASAQRHSGFLIGDVVIEPIVTKPGTPQANWKEFIDWFSGSKIVDTSGDPLTMFHGTPYVFSEFALKPEQKLDYGWWGEGFYFTPSVPTAMTYTERHDSEAPGPIIPVMLSIKKPFEVDSLTQGRLLSAIKQKHEDESLSLTREIIQLKAQMEADAAFADRNKYEADRNLESKIATKLLKDLGYDGVVATFGDQEINEAVAFYPEQIKSVFNEFEKGTAQSAKFSGYAIQTGTPTQEFTDWFDSSKVIKDSGMPLRVYSDDGVNYSSQPIGAPHYLSIKNPLILQPDVELTDTIINRAKSNGYDGIKKGDDWTVFSPEQSKTVFEEDKYSGYFLPEKFSGQEAPQYDPEFYARMAEQTLAQPGVAGGVYKNAGWLKKKLYQAMGVEDIDVDAPTAILRNIAHKHIGLFKQDRAFSEALGNEGIPIAKNSAAKQLELATQMAGRMQVIVERGGLKINKETGDIEIDGDAPSLLKVFERIDPEKTYEFNGKSWSEDQLWQMYAIAKRELALREEVGKAALWKLSTPDLQRVVDMAPPHFVETLERYHKLNNSILQLVEDTGAAGPEKIAHLRNLSYIPLYRAIESDVENQAYIGFTWSSKFLNSLNNPKAFAHKLLGGKQPVDADPIDMIRKNIEGLVRASLANRALKQVAKEMDFLNAQTGQPAYGYRITKSAQEEGGSVMVFRDGDEEIKYKVVDNDVWVALTSMEKSQVAGIAKAMAPAAALLRQGITHSPPFMLANLIRGHIDAWIKYGYNPVGGMIDTFRFMGDIIGGTDAAMAFKANTGMGAFDFGHRTKGMLEEQSGLSRKIKRKLRKMHGNQYSGASTRGFLDTVENIWDAVTRVGEATELAQRMAVSKHLQETGVAKLEADYQGMNLINYSRRGAGGGTIPMVLMNLLPVIPFLNARIQGMYRIFEDQGSKRTGNIAQNMVPAHKMLLRGMILTAIHSAIWAAFKDDDRWKEERIDRKINYDIFYFGDITFYLPRSFEVGSVFGAAPVFALDALYRGEAKDLGPAALSLVANTLSFNPMPQAVKPLFEWYTNFDMYLMRPIESLAMQRLAPERRFTSSTSDIAKLVGDVSGTSPAMIEHIVQGYFGSLSLAGLAFIDSVLQTTGAAPDRPEGLFGDSSLIGGQTWLGKVGGLSRFIRDEDERGTRLAEDFYKLKEEITEVQNTIRDLRLHGKIEEASKLFDENRVKLTLRKRINRQSRLLSGVNKRIKVIMEDDTMPAARKRSLIRELRQHKNEIMRRLNEDANEVLY